MAKIMEKQAVVELDGHEMTRIIGQARSGCVPQTKQQIAVVDAKMCRLIGKAQATARSAIRARASERPYMTGAR